MATSTNMPTSTVKAKKKEKKVGNISPNKEPEALSHVQNFISEKKVLGWEDKNTKTAIKKAKNNFAKNRNKIS